ncbi:hypothetical protein PM082_017565 [Marasmius tenuissimus]|nr:hypothetical protein PM082_017565 [Marasmius tenuissimus]
MLLPLAALSYQQRDSNSTAPTAESCREIRSTVGIGWSCLSMIILCTWTSVHFNVPSVPRSGHWALVFWDKTKIFLVALFAPELIVLWSLRQWFAARDMEKAYRKYGWTMTHAFFALMGGFALYDFEGNFLFHLWDARFCEHFKDEPEEGWDGFSKQQRKLEELCPYGLDQSYESVLEYCAANKMINMTEEEIRSLGHTDLLAKIIAILHTLHFIATCIARRVDKLPTTKLEFITLGFAALTLISYVAWWNKPSGVPFPVRIMDRPNTSSPREQLPDAQNQNEDANSSLLRVTAPPVASRAPGIFRAFWDRIRDDYIDDRDSPGGQIVLLLLLPIRVVIKLIIAATLGDEAHPSQPERGNIFSPTTLGISRKTMTILRLTTSITFFSIAIVGMFHVLPIIDKVNDPAPLLTVPSLDDTLWQQFASWTVGTPFIIAILYIVYVHNKGVENRVMNPTDSHQKPFPAFLAVTIVLLYTTCRIALMVLAAKQLMDLSPNSDESELLKQVKWTTLIPHFGL